MLSGGVSLECSECENLNALGLKSFSYWPQGIIITQFVCIGFDLNRFTHAYIRLNPLKTDQRVKKKNLHTTDFRTWLLYVNFYVGNSGNPFLAIGRSIDSTALILLTKTTKLHYVLKLKKKSISNEEK